MPNRPDERKVTFYLDGFVRLGNMREVLQMPAISRSFKVNVLFVVQSMSQIVDIYGQSGADQLRNTAAISAGIAMPQGTYSWRCLSSFSLGHRSNPNNRANAIAKSV